MAHESGKERDTKLGAVRARMDEPSSGADHFGSSMHMQAWPRTQRVNWPNASGASCAHSTALPLHPLMMTSPHRDQSDQFTTGLCALRLAGWHLRRGAMHCTTDRFAHRHPTHQKLLPLVTSPSTTSYATQTHVPLPLHLYSTTRVLFVSLAVLTAHALTCS